MQRPDGLLREHQQTLSIVWRLFDGFWVACAYVLANLIRGGPLLARDGVAAALAVILFLLLGESVGLYRSWRGTPLKHEMSRIWATWLLVVPLLLLLAFVSRTSDAFSRLLICTWLALAPVLISAWRGGARLLIQEVRRRGRNSRTVAVVGATKMGEGLARMILQTPWLGMRLVGFYDDRTSRPTEEGAEPRRHEIPGELGSVKGSLDRIVDEAKAGRVDIVYITLPLRAEARINALVRRFADSTCSVYVVPDFYIFDLLHAQWSSVGEIPVVSIFESPFYGIDGWLKRVEDVVLGALILAVLAVPMALIALGVKATSPGPVLFRQRRYGLNGHPIHVLKFRTMSVCEDGDVVAQATPNDPRVTRFGAFLRRTSLDELPQFLHVLTGEMSIVGPRPHAVAHNELYRSRIHGYMLRHKVKPGITGWAQVNGWRGETDTLVKMEKRVEHDLHYISHWALLLDLKIIALTIFGAAVRRGAY